MEPKKRGFGLNGSTLKMIAVVTMLIDHIAAVLLVKFFIVNGTWELTDLYQLMRNIGRIAFPIYCFLLVEGFMRTSNVKKYLGRMLLFAFISEIPFDLSFAGKVINSDYQNVMFTLFWGLLAMYVSQTVELKTDKWYMRWFLTALIWLTAAGGAEIMLADYGAKGVGCICVLYLLRYVKGLQLLGGALAFSWEFPAPLSFLFIALYNGEKGRSLKHFFYGFYPVHLLVLYLVSVLLGMGNLAVI